MFSQSQCKKVLLTAFILASFSVAAQTPSLPAVLSLKYTPEGPKSNLTSFKATDDEVAAGTNNAAALSNGSASEQSNEDDVEVLNSENEANDLASIDLKNSGDEKIDPIDEQVNAIESAEDNADNIEVEQTASSSILQSDDTNSIASASIVETEEATAQPAETTAIKQETRDASQTEFASIEGSSEAQDIEIAQANATAPIEPNNIELQSETENAIIDELAETTEIASERSITAEQQTDKDTATFADVEEESKKTVAQNTQEADSATTENKASEQQVPLETEDSEMASINSDEESVEGQIASIEEFSSDAQVDIDEQGDTIDELSEAPREMKLIAAADPAPMAASQSITEDVLTTSGGIDTQSCPSEFYELQLPKDGKLCQVFAADLPASMIFFVPQSPSQVLDFYQSQGSNFSAQQQVKGRYVMQSQDKNMTLIISEDGQGTQVDVLVKSEKI